MTAGTGTTPVKLTRTHRTLISVVVAGAIIIAAIGFAGSYAAVRALAEQKGFGNFSLVFPIGIDAGICVLLALDLLLTWMRIPFPLLRQTAWLLTAATIAFNGAAAWPDPLGVGMHAVIPVLFVVAVEAARHAVGRIADLTADKHMEGVRLTRWLLSPVPTFKLWRRMKLWELRSYEQVIKLEQDRLIYQARLQARFGRNWRRKAPVESLMPLRLAKFGVPLADTGPAGLAAAGIEPVLLPPAPAPAAVETVHPQAELMGEHQRALEASETGAAASAHAEPASLPEPVGAESFVLDEPALPDVDYYEAVQGFISQYGGLPNARQFGLFLAQYGVVDPVSGSVLTEGQLRPILQDFKMQVPQPPVPADDQERPADDVAMPASVVAEGADDRGAWTDTTADSRSFAGADMTEPAVASQPYATEPVLVPTASVEVGRTAGGGVPQQSPREAPTAGAAGEDATVWEATVSDTGEATARLPEQQSQEPDLDPVQQQIVTVAGWLAEAEEAGQKLSGAEVARRLELSPKTGQRRVNAAVEYLTEQRRQQGRAHLRSVSR
ncbi:DUF2637 domain-containing protein [Streptomyces sp. NBC_00724]|uniref:DUF2637 domain-containing protein n=1 Tax=Streptomyces sp. NBC_00724 TaxID=2975812 RepID=UPI002ED433DF|nr:DUF2637 domain-containing protein [Streptomyces sp. NBC_00724]